ncbi:Protein STRUBBELIG-RECEPTOR FAMILY 5 [Ananas comosus]|uniref:Protein STRUBBELIG-RECEPTOR FAMILY 5 n=1 Tax=Ananas comosus TaxID=4615 RepID=A0A199UXW7_ANACO|nr:Protein STRUBBELIG-RECEPTOR FAMILY 5 [Ananas comosus]
MAPYLSLPLLLIISVVISIAIGALAKTDQPDVSALNVMYSSLNSPSQLTGWSSSGGDPCGKGWKGIKCSGSSVTEIDVSENNIHGDIPYQLPPNAVHINLARNAFTGGVPYSISQMTDLEYLNVASNQLNGQLTDMFGKLPKLSVLLWYQGSVIQPLLRYLQNNQFSSTVNVLGTLPLEDLNLENNQFTGWIPSKLKGIDNLQVGGNSWSSGTAPPGMVKASNTGSGGNSLKGNSIVNGVAIAAAVIAVLVVALILLTFMKKRSSSSAHYLDGRFDEQLSQNRTFTPLVSDDQKELKHSSSISMKAFERSLSTGLKRQPSEPRKSFNDNEFANKVHSKRSTNPITMTSYSLEDLRAATGGFSAETINDSGGSSSEFMELVSGVSKLHHPNISELLGYCSEPGHPLLVYEFQRNGSLHDFLHLSDEYSKPLTWDTRIKIALGTARAVEYLHEVCSPSITHKNISSANILLDEELNPHLSECGLTVFYEDPSENLGPGYNAPECIKPSSYTMKSDIYCFGVVMLELLTGRKPYDSSKPRMEQSLVRWATPQLHDIDALAQMVDPALRGLYPPKSLSRFADVIALCVQSEPEFRPPMSEVVQALVRCVQHTSINKRLGGDLSASRRSDDSDSYY